jgi:hypothetical protein
MPSSAVREKPARARQTAVVEAFVRSAEGVEAWVKNRANVRSQVDVAALRGTIERVSRLIDRLRKLVATDVTGTRHAERDEAGVHLRSLIEAGDLLPSALFAQKLGVTRQALSKAIVAQRLFYIELSGERYFPAFFLDFAYERRHLEQVSKCLGELPGATKLQFFRNKKASLGGQTPLQALAKGKFFAVRTAAQGFAER